MSVTMDRVVEAFLSTRNEIASLEKDLEERLKPLKEVQEKREGYMSSQLDKMGAQNVKTAHGTVYRSKKESVRVSEWDAFIRWAIVSPLVEGIERMIEERRDSQEIPDEIGHWLKLEFFNRAVNKTAVLEAMGTDRTEPPPPGVDYIAVRAVQIRKS